MENNFVYSFLCSTNFCFAAFISYNTIKYIHVMCYALALHILLSFMGIIYVVDLKWMLGFYIQYIATQDA